MNYQEWLKDVDVFQMNFIENKEHITPYKAVLDKLKELKNKQVLYARRMERYKRI